jgi:hypothetical protein
MQGYLRVRAGASLASCATHTDNTIAIVVEYRLGQEFAVQERLPVNWSDQMR